MQRCTVPKCPEYKNYGGRGITVCEGWLTDPFAFYRYMDEVLGPRPSKQHTLDRINNDLGYHPGNLRWATIAEQNYNRRPPPGYAKPVTLQLTRPSPNAWVIS